MKKLCLCLAVLMFFSSSVFAAGSNTGKSTDLAPITVFVRGESLDYDDEAQTIVRENRVFVPLRKIAETLGYQVNWDEGKRQVRLSNKKTSMTLVIGKKAYRVDNKEKVMDVVPFIEKNRTYLPMRFVGESLGESVAWDESARVASFGEFPRAEKVTGKKFVAAEGFRFVIPEKYKDVYGVGNVRGYVALYEKKNHDTEWGGYLGNFAIVKSPSDDTKSYLLGKIGKDYLMFYCPGDVNYDYKNKARAEAYEQAQKHLPEVLQTVAVEK